MTDPITPEEYFRGTLKVIAHWSEVDLSGEWETGLRGVIRSITDMAKETLSAHPETNPGAAKAEPATVPTDLGGSDARPNRRLDSSDRGHTFTPAQSSQVSTLAKLADKWRVQAKQYDEAAKECYDRGDDDEGDMNDIEGSALFRCATELDTALKSLAAQPPAAPVETDGDLDELQSELTDSLKPQGELRLLCLKAAEAIARLRRHPSSSAASAPVGYQMTGDNGEWLDPMPARDVDENFKRRYGAALSSGAVKLRALYADEPQTLGSAVRETTSNMAAAVENLARHQEQCDMDGVMVKVSRQALDEVLSGVETINGFACAVSRPHHSIEEKSND